LRVGEHTCCDLAAGRGQPRQVAAPGRWVPRSRDARRAGRSRYRMVATGTGVRDSVLDVAISMATEHRFPFQRAGRQRGLPFFRLRQSILAPEALTT
jgi:hypothetical protein